MGTDLIISNPLYQLAFGVNQNDTNVDNNEYELESYKIFSQILNKAKSSTVEGLQDTKYDFIPDEVNRFKRQCDSDRSHCISRAWSGYNTGTESYYGPTTTISISIGSDGQTDEEQEYDWKKDRIENHICSESSFGYQACIYPELIKSEMRSKQATAKYDLGLKKGSHVLDSVSFYIGDYAKLVEHKVKLSIDKSNPEEVMQGEIYETQYEMEPLYQRGSVTYMVKVESDEEVNTYHRKKKKVKRTCTIEIASDGLDYKKDSKAEGQEFIRFECNDNFNAFIIKDDQFYTRKGLFRREIIPGLTTSYFEIDIESATSFILDVLND